MPRPQPKQEPEPPKKHTLRTIIILVILAIVIGAIIVGVRIVKQQAATKYNDNPAQNASTPGNMYNSGWFAEADGNVYFRNPLDEGCLYVMTDNETKAKKVSQEHIYSINTDGHYIYYSRNNLTNSNSSSMLRGTLLGGCRCDLNGRNMKEFNDKYTGQIVLVGNTIYFQNYHNDKEEDATTFTVDSVDIGGGDTEVLTEQTIDIACTVGTFIYYVGTEDHNIYRMSVNTKRPDILVEGNCWMPIVNGREDLYYLDLDDGYALVHASISNPDEQEVLVDDGRISTYNIAGSYIYFQIDDGDNSKLCRIRTDAGTNEYEVVQEGNFEHINVTSNYVYFHTFQHAEEMYRTAAAGPIRVQRLQDAVEFDDEIKK